MNHKIGVIADIHGCLEEFKELYQKLLDYGILPTNIYSLGDFLDKGDKGPECVTFARKHGVIAVNANHEHKYARYFKHLEKQKLNPSYVIPMKMNEHELEQAARLSKEDIAWIQGLPPYIKIGHYVLLHAGMYSGMKLEDQPHDKLLVIRHLDDKNKIYEVNYHEIHKPLPPNVKAWFETYTGDDSIICGHAVWSQVKPYVRKGLGEGYVISADNSCASGAFLTAIIVDPFQKEFKMEFLQVKAKRVYKPLYAPITEPNDSVDYS